ncbi:hypothetical protein Leryth_010911 [Lithospermum erythrorhizon]|nr:hypothetical protein Leryth_010911 [Lithospermum erythrorhizon]
MLYLVTLKQTAFYYRGLHLDHVILSEYLFPGQSSISRGIETEHVRSMSTTATFFSHVESLDWKLRHPVNSPTVPAPSPAPQGPVPGPPMVFPKRHHRHRRVSTHPVSPSPSTEPDCGQICVEPLTSAVFLSPCGCVLPMKVRLLLQVSLYAIFPVVRDLAMEIAEGTYVNQKQVSINGASADPLTPENSVVDINLIPLEEKFDNTTAMFICTRLLQKKVRLNHSLFGDYEVIFISYPGLPSSPPSGVVSGSGPTGSAGNQQFPITADLVNNSQKLSPRVIFVIGSSAFVLLVVCCGAIVILLKCKKARRPSTSVGPAFGPSIYKRSGLGSILSTSPPSSSSTSLVSSMPVSLLSVKTFSLAELRKATDKFSSKKVLGEGGFGRVYHAILGDGSEVAVKLLTRDNQNGDREFIAEVEMLSRLHHRNLVKLIGICIEERTRCLVYELVSNGNVESHLHGMFFSSLSYFTRMHIE